MGNCGAVLKANKSPPPDEKRAGAFLLGGVV